MIVDSIEIQKVNSDYILHLQKIGRQTFYETFSEENSAEDMLNYLEEGFSIDKLRKELNDINSEFYFAKRNDDIIGYLKLNFGQSQTELKEDNALEIERIYVLKDFQGKGIGQLLYNKAKLIASEKNVNYIWLGV
jgi:GNAT superfamily N-acetyltransferase